GLPKAGRPAGAIRMTGVKRSALGLHRSGLGPSASSLDRRPATLPEPTSTTMGSRTLPLALGVALLSACTITSMRPESGPPRIESDGLLEGHAAFGWRAEDRFLRVEALEGDSDGAFFDFVLWKLFRLEVGALGLAVGVGPFDLALGTLF